MKKIVYFFAVLLLSQCNMSSNKPGTGSLAEIDLSGECPKKEMYLQDIAKVEYIPLETNSHTLMSSETLIIYVSDNYIVAVTRSKGDVFIFDGKGKSKFSFNHKGKSGTEYSRIHSVAFDEKAKEIFIFDRIAVKPKFLVYAEDGEFKRILDCPSDLLLQAYNFDDETLLAYDEYGLNQNKYSNKPYIFISKKDGHVVDKLDINLPVRISSRFIFEVEIDGKKYMTSLTLSMPNNRSYGKNFIISDLSSDTIYKLTPQKELIPLMVRKPSVHSTDPKMVAVNYMMTDKFIFLTKGMLDIELAKKTKQFPAMDLMYDFEMGQLNEIKLINKDFESSNVGFGPAITPENTGVRLLDVAQLFEADETGKIQGQLKQVISSLQEEDNPVLMKIKFQ